MYPTMYQQQNGTEWNRTNNLHSTKWIYQKRCAESVRKTPVVWDPSTTFFFLSGAVRTILWKYPERLDSMCCMMIYGSFSSFMYVAWFFWEKSRIFPRGLWRTRLTEDYCSMVVSQQYSCRAWLIMSMSSVWDESSTNQRAILNN